MKLRASFILLAILGGWPHLCHAQLQVLPSHAEAQCVFGGDEQTVSVVLSNASDNSVKSALNTVLLQATSATAVRVAEAPWKEVQIQPRQTVLETARLKFPAVRAETRFIVRWLEGTNKFIGTTDVRAYPTNLLKDLKSLGGENPVGVFDPQNQLKPLLKDAGVEFVNLENDGVAEFAGRLAIIGPFTARSQMGEGLPEQIQSLAKKDIAVVWLQPLPDKPGKFPPSYYSVPSGAAAVVVVQPELVAGLAENPQAQLNLIHFCRLALHPEPVRLPHLTEQP